MHALQGSTLTMAWVGDSRMVLGRQQQLTDTLC
jgi:serine/threonine protein phosphatase PrpC